MLWWSVALLLSLFSCYLILNVYALASAKQEMLPLDRADEISPVDAILVLGAGVREDGSPSNMLEDRLLTALALYRAGVSDTILVSGDHGSLAYDEVGTMKRYLVENGVPSDRVFMDHAGFSTYDSLYRAEAVFGAKTLVVVTQEYHCARALLVARSRGIECLATPAPVLSWEGEGYSMQPWYSFRESLARCKDFLYCALRIKPQYLGDPISLQGSAELTD